MEYLQSAWPRICGKLKDARHILFLTDYDGTLTPIVPKPEMADLPENMRLLLEALAAEPRFTVGVISGRALKDIREKVGIKDIFYAGNHGLEIQGPGINFINPIARELRPVLQVTGFVLSHLLGSYKGVSIEDKGLSLSIHHRLADERKSKELESVIKTVVNGKDANGQAKIAMGKNTYNIMPAAAWDKGKAITLLMKRCCKKSWKSGLFVMYFGDDLTDEDGFRAINAYGSGLSVLMGETNRLSAANYFLSTPAELGDFMNTLLRQSQRGFY